MNSPTEPPAHLAAATREVAAELGLTDQQRTDALGFTIEIITRHHRALPAHSRAERPFADHLAALDTGTWTAAYAACALHVQGHSANAKAFLRDVDDLRP
ncbi:hypothetical protein ACN20G_33290 (plasmid) [Streptomyces sp. BI20]|uniref:hypothetical protein n=1 Tax=Streptomyces sp. BI20 TaxID=3403460 RepID=UPI003C7249BC